MLPAHVQLHERENADQLTPVLPKSDLAGDSRSESGRFLRVQEYEVVQEDVVVGQKQLNND